jgi:4-hydroxythreonine-4-phosphate dehydrogenase
MSPVPGPNPDAPIAVSMGDPAGVGPEIILKAWLARNQRSLVKFVCFGSCAALRAIDPGVRVEEISSPTEGACVFTEALPVINIPAVRVVTPGRPDPANSAMVLGAIDAATKSVLDGAARALVTGPIHKASLYDAGFSYKGHTDYLAHLCGVSADQAVMMLVASDLRVVPLTIHIPLAKVVGAISTESIEKTAVIILEELHQRFSLVNPRLAIAALNPHAGENGQLGSEESDIIEPAIRNLQKKGFMVDGPFPADTVFAPHVRRSFDAILAMYHDQALTPFKALHFREGVNATLGLPIVRTSPDHGTAFDIAGSGRADPESLIQAIQLAHRMEPGQ